MGKASRLRKEIREDKAALKQLKPVTLEDLAHLEIRGCVHLWQRLDGAFLSITESPYLKAIEAQIGFNEDAFWQSVELSEAQSQANGFYWRNHRTKEFGVIPATQWTQFVEAELIAKGIARHCI